MFLWRKRKIAIWILLQKTCEGGVFGDNYTPDIRSMWGYIVFAFPFVCSFVGTFIRSFVRTFVRSFVFPSQGQSFCVKVYKTSYFEDPLMDFVHIWHDGRYRSKVFISTIPTPG